MLREEICRAVHQAAKRISHEKGIPYRVALKMACQAAMKVKQTGMGQFTKIARPVPGVPGVLFPGRPQVKRPRAAIYRHGMGQEEIFEEAAAIPEVKAIRKAVSPWLWAFSLAAFGMAVLNTRRVSKMFRKWKKR